MSFVRRTDVRMRVGERFLGVRVEDRWELSCVLGTDPLQAGVVDSIAVSRQCVWVKSRAKPSPNRLCWARSGHMSSTVPFWIAFIATVLLLVMALFTGFTRKRKVHLWLGPLTIVSLAFAIWFTEQLMRHYTFPADELAIHLVFAKAGGLMAIPVVVTGIWLWRSERARKWHRVMVFLWLASVVTATGTGLWMFSLGTAKII